VPLPVRHEALEHGIPLLVVDLLVLGRREGRGIGTIRRGGAFDALSLVVPRDPVPLARAGRPRQFATASAAGGMIERSLVVMLLVVVVAASVVVPTVGGRGRQRVAALLRTSVVIMVVVLVVAMGGPPSRPAVLRDGADYGIVAVLCLALEEEESPLLTCLLLLLLLRRTGAGIAVVMMVPVNDDDIVEFRSRSFAVESDLARQIVLGPHCRIGEGLLGSAQYTFQSRRGITAGSAAKVMGGGDNLCKLVLMLA